MVPTCSLWMRLHGGNIESREGLKRLRAGGNSDEDDDETSE